MSADSRSRNHWRHEHSVIQATSSGHVRGGASWRRDLFGVMAEIVQDSYPKMAILRTITP